MAKDLFWEIKSAFAFRNLISILLNLGFYLYKLFNFNSLIWSEWWSVTLWKFFELKFLLIRKKLSFTSTTTWLDIYNFSDLLLLISFEISLKRPFRFNQSFKKLLQDPEWIWKLLKFIPLRKLKTSWNFWYWKFLKIIVTSDMRRWHMCPTV